MRRFITALCLVLFASSAYAQTSTCRYVGQPLRDQWSGRVEVQGGYNSRGLGTMGRTGNIFTQEGFAYDVCKKYNPSTYLTACQWQYSAGNAAYYATGSIDCNNARGEWTDNYGAHQTWYQANKSVTVNGYLYTDGTAVPCGVYTFYGTLNGDGWADVQYSHVGAVPSWCSYSYKFQGTISGPYGTGTWINGSVRSGYTLYRQSGLPAAAMMEPFIEDTVTELPWARDIKGAVKDVLKDLVK